MCCFEDADSIIEKTLTCYMRGVCCLWVICFFFLTLASQTQSFRLTRIIEVTGTNQLLRGEVSVWVSQIQAVLGQPWVVRCDSGWTDRFRLQQVRFPLLAAYSGPYSWNTSRMSFCVNGMWHHSSVNCLISTQWDSLRMDLWEILEMCMFFFFCVKKGDFYVLALKQLFLC